MSPDSRDTCYDGKLEKAAVDKITGTDVASGDEYMYYDADDFRNLYIGDKLYLVREGLVIVYDMANGFERIATCKLR